MSGRLVSVVFESTLPAWLKPYAAAFASFAAPDGSRVYPTVARVARMVGKSERSTKRALRELRARGVLAQEAPSGRYRAPRYTFRAVALPDVEPTQLPLFPQPTRTTRPQEAGESYPQISTGTHRHG